MSSSANAAAMDSAAAIANARATCGGISSQLSEMKKMAGIGTAVSGVGIAAGGGAVVSGVIKKGTDADAKQLSIQIETLRKQRDAIANVRTNPSLAPELQAYRTEFIDFYIARIKSEIDAMIAELQVKYDELEKKSKTLGNVRTGLAAGTTALNVGGAIVASQNKVDADLETQIAKCVASIKDVQDSIMQARIEGADVSKMEQIVAACGEYEYVDLSKINKRALGAQWSSVAGAVVGVGATATSIVANSSNVRNANMEDGADSKKEKNLNTASNVLSGGAAVASGVATVFNAAQIKAIKQVSSIADNCEKALQ